GPEPGGPVAPGPARPEFQQRRPARPGCASNSRRSAPGSLFASVGAEARRFPTPKFRARRSPRADAQTYWAFNPGFIQYFFWSRDKHPASAPDPGGHAQPGQASSDARQSGGGTKPQPLWPASEQPDPSFGDPGCGLADWR